MKKVYYSEPYRKTLVSKPGEATVFYPECGGQPGDCGFADDIRIIDTKKADDGSSVYILEDGKSLDPDREYEFRLDWEHRFKYMVMHTAQHLLSGLLFTLFNIGTVAVHLGEDYLTVEIDSKDIEREKIDRLVETANEKIRENRKIIYHEMSHEEAEALGLRRSIKVDGDVRIVEIEGVDRIACGGVHVSSTSEIQLVFCSGHEQIRNHVRLYFKCGQDAVNTLLESYSTLSFLTSRLSCKSEELNAKFERVSEELNRQKTKAELYGKLIAKSEIEANLENSVSVFETDCDISDVVKACDYFENLALFAINDNHWVIVLKGVFSSVDFNRIRQEMFSIMNAKGGGRTPVFQGICNIEKNSFDYFKNLFTDIIGTGN